MTRILDIWLSGGWVMIPLFAVAVLIYAQAFQLVLYVRRTKISQKGGAHWFQWVSAPESADEGNVADIIRYTQADVRSAKQIRNRFDEVRLGIVSLIDRRTKFVGTLVAAAPLLGLLGTVLGMLQTFFGISTSGGAETAGVVASGISEALVTTQTGLTIALPGLFLVMIIQRQRHEIEASLARLESLTLSHFKFD
ncbi:MAG: MotA/TolQ/ExbB proton channel family protein [Myxococcota bacterium]